MPTCARLSPFQMNSEKRRITSPFKTWEQNRRKVREKQSMKSKKCKTLYVFTYDTHMHKSEKSL